MQRMRRWLEQEAQQGWALHPAPVVKLLLTMEEDPASLLTF